MAHDIAHQLDVLKVVSATLDNLEEACDLEDLTAAINDAGGAEDGYVTFGEVQGALLLLRIGHWGHPRVGLITNVVL